MDTTKFSGTGVALVTPFEGTGIDYNSLESLINHVIEGGVDYLVSLGTTGESVTLTAQEEREVLDFTIQVNAGRVPLVAGNFGGNNTTELVAKLNAYDFEGIDAILSSSPAYNKPTQEGIFRHYEALAAHAPVPVILYNVPGRTASNMTAATTLRIASQCRNVIAVKEASGDMVQGSAIAKSRHEGFLLISGDDPTALSLMACGGNGVISVIANAFPRAFSSLIRAAISGDYKKARALHLALLDIHPLLYVEGNPVGIKAALEILGVIRSDACRLPLVGLSAKTKELLASEIRGLDVP